MTREEIEKLWVGTYVNGALAFERVHKFAALVAAAEREALFQAQNAAIGLTRQLEIYEAALEQIILCREDSLEATKAKQALAQVRGVLL